MAQSHSFDEEYEAPSLRGFDSEVIPVKWANYSRPLYRIITPANLYYETFNEITVSETAPLIQQAESKYKKYAKPPAPIQYLCIGDKESGVEPGFEALRLDNQFWQSFLLNFNELRKLNVFSEVFSDFPNGVTQTDLPKIKKRVLRILQTQEIAAAFSKFVLDKEKNRQLPSPFVIWRFKQDYDEPNVLDNVGPSTERYLKIRGKREFRLKQSRIKENLNAIREAINNDIATEMGYNTQVQQLRLSHYANGKLKFMTVSQLADNYQDLGKAYQLRGDKYRTKEKKGLFRNFLTKAKSFFGAKTVTPPLTGTLLALQVFGEDPDFIGAYGNNKGLSNNQIYLLDLAKGFRGSRWTNTSKSLQDNGHFELPITSIAKSPLDLLSLSRHYLFRNSSMLYDVPFSENMMGFQMLQKFITGKSDPEVIESFGENFAKNIEKVKPKGLQQIFAKYLQKLQELREHVISREDKEEIDIYIKEVTKMQQVAEKKGQRILEVFNERLALTKEQLDLLSNLEKLSSETYDLSDDGRVQISHLQVVSKTRIPWELRKVPDSDYYVLSCDLTKNPLLGNKNRIMIEETIAEINRFLFAHGTPPLPAGNFKWSADGKKAEIKLNSFQLQNLIDNVQDEKVHDYKVPLHSTEEIIRRTSQILNKNSRPKQFANNGDKTRFFSSPPTTKKDCTFCFTSVYKSFIADENKIFGLIAALGLIESKHPSLTEQLLERFNSDSVKMAAKRIHMQLLNELQLQIENISEKKIEDFNQIIAAGLKNLNKLILKPRKNLNALDYQKQFFEKINNWIEAQQEFRYKPSISL